MTSTPFDPSATYTVDEVLSTLFASHHQKPQKPVEIFDSHGFITLMTKIEKNPETKDCTFSGERLCMVYDLFDDEKLLYYSEEKLGYAKIVLLHPDFSTVKNIVNLSLHCEESENIIDEQQEASSNFQYRYAMLCCAAYGWDYRKVMYTDNDEHNIYEFFNMCHVIIRDVNFDTIDSHGMIDKSQASSPANMTFTLSGHYAKNLFDTFLRREIYSFIENKLYSVNDENLEHLFAQLSRIPGHHVMSLVLPVIITDNERKDGDRDFFTEVMPTVLANYSHVCNSVGVNPENVTEHHINTSWARTTAAKTQDSENEMMGLISFYLLAVPEKYHALFTPRLDDIIDTMMVTVNNMSNSNSEENHDSIVEDYKSASVEVAAQWSCFNSLGSTRDVVLVPELMEYVIQRCDNDVDKWLNAVVSMMMHHVTSCATLSLLDTIVENPDSVTGLPVSWVYDMFVAQTI